MVVYHGSNSCFKNLRIHKSLVKHNSTLENEGLGIYFTTDLITATSYGKYIYTLEINDKYLKNFRDRNTCRKYLKEICDYVYSKEKLNIAIYFNLENVINYIYNGGIAVSGIGREIAMSLGNNEHWYNIGNTKIERVYKILRNYDKNNLHAYLFNYNIKNIGIIKKIDYNIVRIVKREKAY